MNKSRRIFSIKNKRPMIKNNVISEEESNSRSNAPKNNFKLILFGNSITNTPKKQKLKISWINKYKKVRERILGSKDLKYE